MKKVMILGAGKGQVPIINLAKRCGFETFVVSIPGNYPGLEVADNICEVDIRDKERVLDAARKEKVDGIVADQIDIAVPTVAYVTEKLGLPSIGYECALKFTNKYLMRKECEKLNINAPKYSKAYSLDEAVRKCQEVGLPVVIKPTDNAGSKGVSLIRNIDSLKERFDNAISFSKEKCVIIEKYIEGTEYVVSGFASNFKFTNLAIAERKYFDIPDTFVFNQSLFRTSASNAIEERVLKTNENLIEGFGLKFGVTHSEYIVEKDTEEIYLVEVAARGGGINTSSDIIPAATGIEVNRLLLDIAVGYKDEIVIGKIDDNVAGYLCFSLPKGIVRSIKGIEAVRSLPNVYKSLLDSLYIGMETKEMTDKSMRIGPIIIKGKSMEECEDAIAEVKRLLEVNVETTEGIKGIVW
jgi:biotin carboxylase